MRVCVIAQKMDIRLPTVWCCVCFTCMGLYVSSAMLFCDKCALMFVNSLLFGRLPHLHLRELHRESGRLGAHMLWVRHSVCRSLFIYRCDRCGSKNGKMEVRIKHECFLDCIDCIPAHFFRGNLFPAPFDIKKKASPRLMFGVGEMLAWPWRGACVW